MAMEPGLEILTDERTEHQDPPEAEHDARNRGEQLDERGDQRTCPAWRQLAQIEPDRDRERSRDQERGERRQGSTPDQVQCTELVVDSVPALTGDEGAKSVVARRGASPVATEDAGVVRDIDTPQDLER